MQNFGLGQIFVDDLAHPLAAGLGRDGDAAIAVARERRGQRRRDAIGLERRRRKPPAAVGHGVGDFGHARHARHLGADQPDHAALGKSALGLGDQIFGTAIANRTIHEAGRAETASPLASAARLDQVHVAEDGLLGEDQRRGGEAVEVVDQPAADSRQARPAIVDARETAGLVVDRREVVGKICAVDQRERAQALRAVERVGLAKARDELGHHLLALADQKEIDEIGDRLGIEEHRRAAGDDQRIVAPGALGARERDTRHPQHRDAD